MTTPSWTTLTAVTTGEVVTAAKINSWIDNLDYIHTPQVGASQLTSDTEMAASTSYADVHGSELQVALTPRSSAVVISFSGSTEPTASAITEWCIFNIERDDGSTPAEISSGAFGITAVHLGTGRAESPLTFTYDLTGLTPGQAYTFTLRYKYSGAVSTDTLTLHGGSRLSVRDIP